MRRHLLPVVGLVVLAATLAGLLALSAGGPSDEAEASTPFDTVLAAARAAAPAPVFEVDPDAGRNAALVTFAKTVEADQLRRYAAAVEAQRLADFAAAVEAAEAEARRAEAQKAAQAQRSSAGAPAVAGGSVWDRLAQCESGGNWSMNTGNGFYGGLQFMQSTWVSVGGTRYAPAPHLASREQQIAAAETLLARSGWGQWPACSTKLGLR